MIKQLKLQRADFAALGASLIWGLNYTSVKLALVDFPPLVMGMLRLSIAGIALLILLKQFEGTVRVSWKYMRRMMLAGITGLGIQQILFLTGVSLVDASISALVGAFTSALMLVIASFIAHERLTRLMVWGVIIACAGMVCVVLGKEAAFTVGNTTWLGCLLVLAAGIIGGFTPLLNKETLTHRSSLCVTTWTIFIGSLCFLPLSATSASSVSWLHIPAFVWAAVLFTALGATAFTNILWNYGVAHIGVVRMGIYGYLPSILGVVFATILLHDVLTPIQWLGAGLTLGGVAISQFSKTS